jgi:hypothetical protein
MSRIGMISLVATIAAGLLFACGDKNAPLSPGGTGGAADGGGGGSTPGLDGACGVVSNPSTGVSFAADIKPLLAKSCSCHVTGSIAPALKDHVSVSASAEASSAAIANGSMPISAPLSAEEQALFESWLKAGKPNN